jgi:hypothetical protein
MSRICDPPPGAPPDDPLDDDDGRMHGAYIRVLVINAFVIAALWAFSRHFGS